MAVVDSPSSSESGLSLRIAVVTLALAYWIYLYAQRRREYQVKTELPWSMILPADLARMIRCLEFNMNVCQWKRSCRSNGLWD